VCNVSRAVVAEARARYARVAVVLVTAPDAVLAARLAARDRGSDGDIEARVTRALPFEISADAVIENVGSPEAGAALLVDLIRRRDVVVSL
jgi:ribose 1,5-bisphosphokinase